jgi:hypothetical protein
VAFSVVCGDRFIETNTAALWFFHSDETAAVNGIPSWRDTRNTLNKIVLAHHGLYHFAAPTDNSLTASPPDRKRRAILVAGDDVLIELRDSAQRLVKVSLDMDSPVLAGTAQYALLMLGLIDLTVARSLIDEVDTTQHSVIESDIAPRRLTIAEPYSLPDDPVGSQNHLTPWLIGLALLLLTCDVCILALKRFRGRSAVEAASHA